MNWFNIFGAAMTLAGLCMSIDSLRMADTIAERLFLSFFIILIAFFFVLNLVSAITFSLQ
jgi:hypothetical protein